MQFVQCLTDSGTGPGQWQSWTERRYSRPRSDITPGSHPSALLLSPDEKWLYVAVANADAIAVVDTETAKLLHVASTNLPEQKYPGSVPNALAQSEDGSRLFVADASLNAIAVFDTSRFAHGKVSVPPTDMALGFIPTDWYPSALAVRGDDLLIAAAKGTGSGANNGISEIKQEKRHRAHPYIPTLVRASVARLDFKKAEQNMAELTREVEADNLIHADPGKIEFVGGVNPIKHVIYILKENRTYDQIFGDLRVGNGDPSLTMYGEDITPNEHKLALQFGVLDNFYDSGEVSGDGHVWSLAAITSDYNEKTWPIAYRGKERTSTTVARWPTSILWSMASQMSTIPLRVIFGAILLPTISRSEITANSSMANGASRRARRLFLRRKVRRTPAARIVLVHPCEKASRCLPM